MVKERTATSGKAPSTLGSLDLGAALVRKVDKGASRFDPITPLFLRALFLLKVSV
ncbi:MAG TPA: hypothetical protein VHJ19_06235 [Gammaproteobacteria bacterium]|nr:hypothetical protein [Gammaproteobacteria bacterium]